MYNLYNFEAEFKEFLQDKQVSSVTVRNYLSDFRHFWSWLLLTLEQKSVPISEHDAAIFTYITSKTLDGYRQFLIFNEIPSTTINRRLATVRRFIDCATVSGWMSKKPLILPTNVAVGKSWQQKPLDMQIVKKTLIEEFERFLNKKKVSDITKRGYLTDVRHFLTWTEKKLVTSD